jgi:hypothetical protein
MLQELSTPTAAAWASVSLLFFAAVYVFVSVRVFRARDEDLEAAARLVLDDGREEV